MENNIIPENDGITHINIYSKAKTQLGLMLSNFYHFECLTDDGKFQSVEGYWYYLSIGDCKEKEVLRNLYGFSAKQKGKDLLKFKDKRFDEIFETKILKAIWYKFRRNAHLLNNDNKDLPFEHYYNYQGKIVYVKDKYPWLIDGITKMRIHLLK